jgi:hypothetical protein
MEISYYLIVDDLVPLTQYVLNNSPRIQRQIRISRVGFPLFILIVSGFFILLNSPFRRVLPYLVAAGLWFLFWPIYFRWTYVRNAVRGYREGSSRVLFGRFTMRIEDEGLFRRSELVESRYRWSAFEQAVFTDTHAFLFISPFQAVIIPKAAVVEGDYDAFVAALQQHLPPSTGPQNGQFVLSA